MKIRFATSFARDRVNAYMSGREYDIDDNEARRLVKAGVATKVVKTPTKGTKPNEVDADNPK